MSPPDERGELQDLELYRALVEGIPAIVYLDRPDEYSTNFYTSPQAVDLLGYTQEEWGTDQTLWIEQIHPEDRAHVLFENRRSNEVGDNFFAEYRMIARDGRVVWIRDEAVLMRDANEKPLHWRGFMLDITAQKEAEEKLRWSLEVLRRTSQQRRELMERLETAQEEERRRIAADIHDDSIQVMSAVDMRLQTFAMQGGAEPAALQELHETVQLAIERLRHLVFELRPAALDREGLVAAIRQYLQHMQAENGVEWTLDSDGLLSEPGPELRGALYRMAREAVMNVRKHAAATRVSAVVATAGAGIIVRISDDGHGFDPATAEHAEPGHVGLRTTMERAEVAGGWCRIQSSPGAGTTIELWLPLMPVELASEQG